MCAVTRAMFLTGADNHIAGMGSQNLETGYFGYEGYLTNRVVTLPQLLKQQGYGTAMAGKWHLGFEEGQHPADHGFDCSFALLEGGANHYNNTGPFPNYPRSPYTENGEPATWPEGKYSTNFYTDKVLEYMEQHRRKNKPFFAYAAYTSPHWPLRYTNTQVFLIRNSLMGTRYTRWKGESMVPLLKGKTARVHDDDYVFALEHRGRISVRKGNWKLVNSAKPYDENNFELFNLATDPGEQENLQAAEAEKYQELLAEWENYRKRVQVQLPTPEQGSGW